jgi:hypothetical protein
MEVEPQQFTDIDTQEYQTEQPDKPNEEEIIDNFFDELDNDIVLNKSDEYLWYTSWYMIVLYVSLGILFLVLFIYLIKKNASA